jgi:hypothetical protein
LQHLIRQEMARDNLIATDLVDYMLGNQRGKT